MFRRFLVGFGILLSGFLAHSQGKFHVVFSEGRNYRHNEKGFSELKIGTLLKEEDQLEILPNGQVIIMDEQGRFLTLELDGKYKLSTINLSNITEPSDLIYQEWERFSHPKRLYPQEYEHHFLDEKPAPPAFELDFPASTEVYGRYINLSWPDVHDNYRIDLINAFEDVFQSYTTDSSEFTLDLLSENLAFKDNFAIRVTALNSGKETGVYCLDKMSPPDKELLDQLLRKLPNTEELPIELTKAIIFENRGLYADAATQIKHLLKKYGSPLKGFYQAYLERNGF